MSCHQLPDLRSSLFVASWLPPYYYPPPHTFNGSYYVNSGLRWVDTVSNISSTRLFFLRGGRGGMKTKHIVRQKVEQTELLRHSCPANAKCM